MILGCTGDWHLRATRPRNRTDTDYVKTMFDKVEFLLKHCGKCKAILQPADLFDTFKLSHVPHHIVRKTADLLLRYCWDKKILFFTQRGQHDTRYRNDIEDSPLAVLEVAEILWVAEEEDLGENVVLYGSGWEKEIPMPRDPNKFNVLLVHAMITEEGPMWHGQENYITANDFLKKYPYDLVVSGDNHQSFIVERGEQTLINCGSLMRTNVDQKDHQPFFVLFDTETRRYEPIPIPIVASEEVMKLDEAIYDKDQRHRLDAFVSGLDSNFLNAELNYLACAEKEKEESKISEEVYSVFLEAYEACKEEAGG